MRNRTAVSTILRALVQWEGADHLPDQLNDLVEAGILEKVPEFEAPDHSTRPFIYAGGWKVGDNHQLTLLVAPEPEKNGLLFTASFDEHTEYLSPAAANAAMEKTRERVRKQRAK